MCSTAQDKGMPLKWLHMEFTYIDTSILCFLRALVCTQDCNSYSSLLNYTRVFVINLLGMHLSIWGMLGLELFKTYLNI